jgi:streptogramin lyase
MSEQWTDRETEKAFAAWIEDVAPKSPPTRLLESTFVRTMGTRQERVYPWNKLTLGRRGLSNSGSGARFAIVVLVGMVVLAMAIGIVGGGAFGPTATPSPSPIPSPTPVVSAAPTLAPPPSPPAAISVVAEATIDVSAAIAMVSDGQHLWVLAAGGRMDRIDAGTASVTKSAIFGPPTDLYNGLSLGADALWATDADNSTLYRLDPTTLKVATTVTAGLSPKGVHANADGVWVADVHGGAVLRINPTTNNVEATITVGPTGPSGPNWLAEGQGSIWVDIPNNSTIARVDPVTDTVQATIQAPPGFVPCGGIVIADDGRHFGPLQRFSAWVTSCEVGTSIARIDAASNEVISTLEMGGNGYNPALINGFVWISVDGGDAESGRLVRIEPVTNTIDRVLVPSTSFGGGGDIAVAAGKVWVVDPYHNTVIGLPTSVFAP